MAMVQAATDGATTARGIRQETLVEDKGADGRATSRDIASDEAIRQVLKRAFPETMIISEEQELPEFIAASALIVDPRDGTENAIRGDPFWGVSIGYLDAGSLRGGVMLMPELGICLGAVGAETYYAAPPNLMERCAQFFWRSMEKRDVPPRLMVGTDVKRGDHLERLDFLGERVMGIRSNFCCVWSTLSFLLGFTDVYYCPHGARAWDFAAAVALCRLQGGVALDPDGSQWVPTLEKKGLILAPTEPLAREFVN